ncbi:MAG TPA: GntG family PLP-dependent aldolase [Fimbriimonadaceae bacterium]|nr:GntG family PLP-dependent aldolase [Fimbriimonadaceae bacterium]
MIVDLRSDTVTRPTAEMYEAMAAAPLGDDVLGDEPTVDKLEKLAAQMTGKEAAMFVPSGTMGNQIAMATHCDRGDAVLIEEEAHMVYYEVGGPGVLANVVTWTLPSDKGVMDPNVVESHVLKRNIHTPGTTLLCLENTHNRAGGTVIPMSTMREYRQVADRHGMKIHLDGARVFNAAVALNLPVREIADQVDSINFCLSKGLRSPVGSVLCGPAKFIEDARIWRKRLGGGMRQAGILAACGIVSLTKMVDRLAEDHRRARALAEMISELPGLTVDWDRVQTNIVLVSTDAPAAEWCDRLHEERVWCFPVAPNRFRLVVHADVGDPEVERAGEVFRALAKTPV